MRKALFALLALAMLLGAAAAVVSNQDTTAGPTGKLSLSVGGASLSEMGVDHLNVTFSKARAYGGEAGGDGKGWTDVVVNDTPVDLLELDGATGVNIADLALEEGTYHKIELEVEDVTASVDGEDVHVFVPSGRLKLLGKFVVTPDSPAVYDIDLRLVERGKTGMYNLLPIISKRGGNGGDGNGGDGDDDDGSGADGNGGGKEKKAKGAISLALGRSRAGIDDFDHLNVTFDKVRIFTACNNSTEENWTEEALDNVTVDLTNLTATNEVIVGNLSLDAGNYSKVELFVSDVVGIVDGWVVDVKVPSGRLKVVGAFNVSDNETLEFTFDIHVVQKGKQPRYNLTPVIARNQGSDDDDDE